nr:RNA-binding cell elongation regulator Jag/EloR [Caldalkalibacillus salinus]
MKQSDEQGEPNSTERTAEVEYTSAFVHTETETETVPLKQSDSLAENTDELTSHTSEKSQTLAVQEGQAFLEEVLAKMNIPAKIEVKEESDQWTFDVTGDKIGLMIGRRGQTLDALQYLTNVVANRYTEDYVRIILDAENYRKRRKETLQQLSDRMAKKVITTRAKVSLEPMNAAERKIIHTHLQSYAGVLTESEGREPNRHVVILPK